MSEIAKYLLATCIREASMLAKIGYGSVVGLSFVLTLSTAKFGWPSTIIPWWVYAVLCMGAILVFLVWVLGKRSYKLDEEKKPKLEICFEAKDPWIKHTVANIPSKSNPRTIVQGDAIYVRFQVKNPKPNTLVKGCRAYLRNIEFYKDGKFDRTSYSDTQKIRWAAQSDDGLGKIEIPYFGDFFVDLLSTDDHYHKVFVKWDSDLLVNVDIFDQAGVYRFSVFVISDDGVEADSKRAYPVNADTHYM